MLKKSVSPLIAIILLIVVAVVLVVIVLDFGKTFSINKLNRSTKSLTEDTSLLGFISLSSSNDNFYRVKNNSKEEVTFTKYIITSDLNSDYDLVNTVLTLTTPMVLSSGGAKILPLLCQPSRTFNVNLITDDNKYVSLKVANIRRYEINGCSTQLLDGAGTEANPYKIYNVFQLDQMRNNLDSYFVLEQNIDFNWFDLTDLSFTYSGFSDYDTSGWDSIGDNSNKFTGVFDGQGNVIKNLYVNRPSTDFVGLFGWTYFAEINNIGLENVNVSGYNYVGSLVGNNKDYSEIFNSYSTGSVSGTGDVVGGLVGSSFSSTISNSYSTSSVSGDSYVGGLVGNNNYNSEISNSYSTGCVSGDSYVGGLIAINRGSVFYSYSVGEVSGNSNVGGLVGSNSATVTNSYWDTETSNQSTSVGGTGQTTSELKNLSTIIDVNYSLESVVNVDFIDYNIGYVNIFQDEGPIASDVFEVISTPDEIEYSVVVENGVLLSWVNKLLFIYDNDNIIGECEIIDVTEATNELSLICNVRPSLQIGSYYDFTVLDRDVFIIERNTDFGEEVAGPYFDESWVGRIISILEDEYEVLFFVTENTIVTTYNESELRGVSYTMPPQYNVLLVNGDSFTSDFIGSEIIIDGDEFIVSNFISENNIFMFCKGMCYYELESCESTWICNEDNRTNIDLIVKTWDFSTIWNINEGQTYPYLRNNTQSPLPE